MAKLNHASAVSMRATKLLALCLGALLALAPVEAFAASIAIVSGTGTGGSQADPAFNAGSSLTMPFTTASIPSGSFVAVLMYNGTAGTASSGWTCTDTQSNTYVSDQGAQSLSGAGVQIIRSYTAHALTSSDSVTCTQIAGVAGIVGQVLVFSGTSSTPYDSASPAGAAGSGTSAPAGTSGTLNGPCGAANCEVLIGLATFKNGGTITNDAAFTTTAPLNGGRQFVSGYKIVSATTAVSYTPTTGASSGNWAAQLEGFKAAAAAATLHSRTLLGVGQ